jgi:hypothetical protein
LSVRAEPNTDKKVLGYLYKDDTVPAIGISTDGKWVQILRLDGLTGWCIKSSMSSLGNLRPKSLRQKLFDSTTYFRNELTNPRLNVIHVLGIDLRVGVPEFLVTPPSQPNGVMCTRTTSQFLEKYGVHIAINGDGFSHLTPSANGPVYCPDGGDPVTPNGFAASRGVIYSQNQGPTVYISKANEVTFDKVKNRVFNAVSGDRAILVNGQMVKNLAVNPPSPRTAIGLSKIGNTLLLMVVDGRQPGYSEGVDFPELVNLMVSFGAYNATNMDGGGSSAMVIKGLDGKAHILNSPCDNNIPGKERAVANHLGVFFRK